MYKASSIVSLQKVVAVANHVHMALSADDTHNLASDADTLVLAVAFEHASGLAATYYRHRQLEVYNSPYVQFLLYHVCEV